jgi:uncharacterized protein (TIGR00369 family)
VSLALLVAELERCPFHDLLRPEAVHTLAGAVVVRLPFRPELGLAPDGDAFHGGVLASLVDLTGHAAIALSIGRVAPTVDLRIDYLRPARGAELLATGQVLHAGSSLARADVQVHDEAGVLVAAGRGTFSTRATGDRGTR